VKKVILFGLHPAITYGYNGVRRATVPSKKKQTVIRLTDAGRDLLTQLAERNGLSQTGVIEILIREAAKQEGLRSVAASARATDERPQASS
jgi:hypothetical protein